jgi:cytochrome c oxidase subunit II
MMARHQNVTFAGAILLALGVSACETPPPGIVRGEELYETCAACHEADGAGNPEIQAPAIAGLPQWYIEAQLQNFQAGARGKHPDDLPGLRMRAMAVSLNREGDIPSVAEYVASLPVHFPQSTLQGNAGAGASFYGVCVACHGTDGMGNEMLHAPPIAQMDDWYLVEELENFKIAARGGDPSDTWGAAMRVNAMMLDDQAMADVIAYVQTLR